MVAALLLLIAGCSSGGPTAGVSTPPASPALTTPPVHPAGVGLGATVTAWSQAYIPDSSEPTGSTYDPDPALDRPGDKGKTADRYNALMDNGGRVTDYVERFATATTLTAARKAVLAELPTDTTKVWSTVIDGCAVDVFHSGTIATWFTSAIGDNSGLVLVEYFTDGDHFTATDVERATFDPSRDDPSRDSFTEC
jgi:hypothetical protein